MSLYLRRQRNNWWENRVKVIKPRPIGAVLNWEDDPFPAPKPPPPPPVPTSPKEDILLGFSDVGTFHHGQSAYCHKYRKLFGGSGYQFTANCGALLLYDEESFNKNNRGLTFMLNPNKEKLEVDDSCEIDFVQLGNTTLAIKRRIKYGEYQSYVHPTTHPQ
jgi:hypothetical protein